MSAPADVLVDTVLGEEVHRFVVPSGLQVLVHRKPGFQKRFAVLAANYGSIDCTFRDRDSGRVVQMPDGIAHFLEHKLFEQAKSDALEVFSRQGASGNASTSFRTTSFYFNCSGRFRENLRTLLRFVLAPHMTEAAVEKEKGIIEQEIRMYEDSPDWRGFIHLVRGLYVRHPVRTDITGTVESVRLIDREKLLTCYRNFYAPGNLCLVVSGDVDPDVVLRIAEGETSGVEPGGRADRVPENEPARIAHRRVAERADVPRAQLFLGFKDTWVPVSGEEMQRRELVTGVLLALMFGASSRTWQRLYEQGDIDDTFSTSYAGEEDFGFVTLAAETDEPERTRQVLLREIRRFAREGFSTEDFGRVIHNRLGRFVRGLDSQEGTAFHLLTSAFRGVHPFRVPTLLRRLDLDAVMDRHRTLFGERNHTTSIVSRL